MDPDPGRKGADGAGHDADGRPGTWTSRLCRGYAIALVVAIVFIGCFDNGFVNWDDGIYIEGNPLVTDPGRQPLIDHLLTPGLGYPLPVPVLIYRLAWAVTHGAWLFHALSLAVHALNSVLLFTLLRLELAPRREVAWVATLCFALHPIVVEPVAWATGLKDLLVGTACLTAMLALRGGSLRSLPSVLLGLASKPTASLLGPVLIAARYGERGLSGFWPARELVALVSATLAGLGLIALTALQETPQLRTTAEEPTSLGRILGAAGLALEHLIVPSSLAPRYPVDAVGAVHVVAGGLALIGVVAVLVRLVQRRRLPDPRFGWWALILATYLPVSNLRPLERFTADSYLYVPWMGICAVLAHGFVRHHDAIQRMVGRTWSLLRAAPLLAVVAWIPLTVMQVETWSDTEALWGSAARAYPDDGESVFRYGDALGRAGERRAEMELYLERLDVLERSPKIPPALVVWYEDHDELEEADRWYRLGFQSDVKQEHGFYWHYVEYVARHPERHDPEHDPGLAHSLGVYAGDLGRSRLGAAELEALAVVAHRLGRTDVAERLRARSQP